MFFLFYQMSRNGGKQQFLYNRVSAKRHLTIDTVPVTLLDIHLECDKVKYMELVPILIVTNCLWCRAWHPGVIVQGPHQTQTNQIGEQSNRPTPEKAFLKVVAGRTKTHITDHFLSRSRDEDVVVPLIPKKQRPQKKFWTEISSIIFWPLLNLFNFFQFCSNIDESSFVKSSVVTNLFPV